MKKHILNKIASAETESSGSDSDSDSDPVVLEPQAGPSREIRQTSGSDSDSDPGVVEPQASSRHEIDHQIPKFAGRPPHTTLNNQFECFFTSCGQTESSKQNIEKHLDDCHLCRVCAYYFENVYGHDCQRALRMPLSKNKSRNHLDCHYYPHCKFWCGKYSSYNGHMDAIHRCEHCAHYFGDPELHQCPRPGQRGGHNPHLSTRITLGFFRELTRTHHGAVVTYRHVPDEPQLFDATLEYNKGVDIFSTFFNYAEKPLVVLLEEHLDIYPNIMVKLLLKATLTKERILNSYDDRDELVEIIQRPFYFPTVMTPLYHKDGIPNMLNRSIIRMNEELEQVNENGSGWHMKTVDLLDVTIAKYTRFANSHPKGYLPMPSHMRFRKGFINIRNVDNKCLQYCVVAARYSQRYKRKDYPFQYDKHFQDFDFRDIEYPCKIYSQSLKDFELKNDLSITVYSNDEEGEVFPIRTPDSRSENHIDLFLIQNDKNESHFVLIKNLKTFSCNGKLKSQSKLICHKCEQSFALRKSLDKHIKTCKNETSKKVYPKDKVIKFSKPWMTLPYPFMIFYDFESFLVPTENDSSVKRRKTDKSTKTHIHKPASYSLCIVENKAGRKIEVKTIEYYNGPNVVEVFIKKLFYHANQLISLIRKTNNACQPDRQTLYDHYEKTNCEYCGKKFDSSNQKNFRTMHHNHFTHEVISTICVECNLKIKYKHEIPILGHNTSNYDMHLIVDALNSKIVDGKDIDVVARNAEKFVGVTMTSRMFSTPLKLDFGKNDRNNYISCKPDKIRFIDTFQFLPMGLDRLIADVRKGGVSELDVIMDGFRHLVPGKGNPTPEELELITSKLKFPYRFLSTHSVFDDNVLTPGKEHFYNDLKDEHLTDEEWGNVEKVMNTFNLQKFRDFAKFYNNLDTLLLAQVWCNFARTGQASYGLDPSYNFSAPSFSWDCCFYHTKAEVACIDSEEMLRLISDGIKGGQCYATERKVFANTERFGHTVNDEHERTHIISVDINSLYASSLTKPLPYKDLKFIPKSNKTEIKRLTELDWKNWDESSETGYLLRCNLKYPRSIHRYTEDLPLAPELRVISSRDLSEEQLELAEALKLKGINTKAETKRLLLTCLDKTDYVCNSNALKYYLSMGMELSSISEAMSYTQSEIFKPYILKNLEFRAAAKNDFESDYFKLLSNSLYGKTCESPEKYTRVKICTSRSLAEEWMSERHFRDWRRLNDNVSLFFFSQPKIIYDKPIFMAQAILDLSKIRFYTAYYQELKKVFPPTDHLGTSRCRLLYTDTDGVYLKISDPKNTLYEDILQHYEFFDFSKIPSYHDIFHGMDDVEAFKKINKGKMGMWKIESLDILVLYALKAKQYSVKYFISAYQKMLREKNEEDRKKIKLYDQKAHGIPKASMKQINHEDYGDALDGDYVKQIHTIGIRSIGHKVYTVESRRVGLHGLDFKRKYCSDMNKSWPFGYRPDDE